MRGPHLESIGVLGRTVGAVADNSIVWRDLLIVTTGGYPHWQVRGYPWGLGKVNLG